MRKGKQNKPKEAEVTDLEVARKMIKIHQSAQDRKLEFDISKETSSIPNVLLYG